jgi:hypothetical protein
MGLALYRNFTYWIDKWKWMWVFMAVAPEFYLGHD